MQAAQAESIPNMTHRYVLEIAHIFHWQYLCKGGDLYHALFILYYANVFKIIWNESGKNMQQSKYVSECTDEAI